MFLLVYQVLLLLIQVHLSVNKDILEITTENISTLISYNHYVFVMFYDHLYENCGHTKAEFSKSSELLTHPEITFVQVDCLKNCCCKDHSFTRYPALKLFKSGTSYEEYLGKMSTSDILKYLKSKMEPIRKLSDNENITELILNSKTAHVIGYFCVESNLKRIFKNVSSIFKLKAKFAYFEKYEETNNNNCNIVQLIRPFHLKNVFENSILTYVGSGNDLKDFILKNIHGLVGHRQPHNIADFQDPSIIVYYNIDYEKDPKGTNYWRNRVLKVAKNYKNITFAISSLSDFQDEVSRYDSFIDTEKIISVVAAKDKRSKTFIMYNNFGYESLSNFTKLFNEDKLQLCKRSESANNTILIANASNLRRLILETEKDIFIIFYSPYCEYSAKIVPVFDKLAEMLKFEDVLIAKMNGVTNEVPKIFNLRGYPAIYLILKDAKYDPIEYVGSRKLLDYIEYIAKYATTELENYDRDGRLKNKRIEL